jgi:hypothetical protein
VEILAKHIEEELHRGLWSYCAIHEDELQEFWPLDAPYRELRIARCAAKYGYRLRFYQKGMCAIFDRQPGEAALGVRDCKVVQRIM